jgi:hypothetical protein
MLPKKFLRVLIDVLLAINWENRHLAYASTIAAISVNPIKKEDLEEAERCRISAL